MLSEALKISSTRPGFQMPSVKSSSSHTMSSFSSGSSGCDYLVLVMRIGVPEASSSKRRQKLSSLSFARFQDLLDNLYLEAFDPLPSSFDSKLRLSEDIHDMNCLSSGSTENTVLICVKWLINKFDF